MSEAKPRVGSMKRWMILVAVAACGGSAVDDTAAPETIEPAKDAIAKTTENGPVKATIKVWPAKPTLGDPIYARLEIDAPAGVTVEAPFQEAGDQRLGRFGVVAFTRDSQRKPDGGQLQIETYTLEAPSSGRHRVPPLRIEMIDSRNASATKTETTKPQEILTDEVPIEVAPVKAEAVDAKLRDARGDLEPDVGGTPWMLIVGVLSAAAVVGSASVLIFRGIRTKRRVAKQRSAYEEAIHALLVLSDRGAPSSEDADSWFVELSAIIRRYIELRFDIRAPELTTEEFLQVALPRPELTTDHRGLLTQFLERCDRVKFAGYRPDSVESLATLEAARAFVDDTKLQEQVAA